MSNRAWINLFACLGISLLLLAQTPTGPVGRGAGSGVASITAAGIKQGNWCLAASGSGTTYTCSTTNSSTLAIGQLYIFGIDMTNSGNVTLNVNSQGAKAVLHKDGSQFASGDLTAADSIVLIYDGTQFVPISELLSTNPGATILTCGTAPGTPASDKVVEYCNSDRFFTKNDGGTVHGILGSGASAMGTSAIGANACATVVTVGVTGVLTSDIISFNASADLNAVTGYGKAATDGLNVYDYPTADNVNFKVCNVTGSSITPGAATINWIVQR